MQRCNVRFGHWTDIRMYSMSNMPLACRAVGQRVRPMSLLLSSSCSVCSLSLVSLSSRRVLSCTRQDCLMADSSRMSLYSVLYGHVGLIVIKTISVIAETVSLLLTGCCLMSFFADWRMGGSQTIATLPGKLSSGMLAVTR